MPLDTTRKGAKRLVMTSTERAYYKAFLLSMIICWSPWKPLAYFAPILAVLWFIWAAPSRTAYRRALWWVCGWLLLIAAYWVLSRRFDVVPALLAIVTYGTFGALFAIPNKGIDSTRLLRRMLRLVALFLVIEATVGIAQAVVGAVREGTFDWNNGDVVQGTIDPSFRKSLTFGNPMFASNMAFMLIGLLPFAIHGRKWRGTALLGLAAFVLASVMHAIFFLAAALGVAYLLCKPRLSLVRGKTFLVSALCALPLLTYVFLSANVSTVSPIIRHALAGQTPRAIVMLDSVTRLPREYPLMPLVGLGPGQFSSRAALLASGDFLDRGERSLPLIRPQSSPAFKRYLAPLVRQARNPAFGGSSTVEPFFSWLSVYTEFGLPCLLGLLGWATIIVFRVRRLASRKDERLLGTAVVAGVVFLVLLGLQLNYWEVPQAILIGALLTKVSYATLVGKGSPSGDTASRTGGRGARDQLGVGPQLA